MSKECYSTKEFVDKLYNVFKLFEYRFTSERTSEQVDNYVNSVIPDKVNEIFHVRHIRSRNAKIIYFMNSKHKNHYDMLMDELKHTTFFVMTFKDILESEKPYISKDMVDDMMSSFELDPFSLRINVEEKTKELKIYTNVNEEVYDEPRS